MYSDEEHYYILVHLKLNVADRVGVVEELIRRMSPEDICYKVLLIYNTHAVLHKFTHAQLHSYTAQAIERGGFAMTKTKYYDLQMDDPQDDYDVDVVNANLKKIDEQMKTMENATDALQEPEFTVAAKRENIASKEKMPKILGKIAKFFADLKTVAFSGEIQ